MAKPAGVIEINGVRYNAASGDAVGRVRGFAGRVRPNINSPAVDGFVKAKQKLAPVAAKPVVKHKTRISTTPKMSSKTVHHSRERSKTLVRTVVVKPSLRVREASKTFARPIIREGLAQVDSIKESRAKMISKHSKVERFGIPKPKADITHPHQVVEAIARPTSAQSHQTSTNGEAAMPSMLTSASHQQLERLLDFALHTATSHKKTAKRRPQGVIGRFFSMPKWLAVSLGILIILLVTLLFAWKNIPAVAVRIAGAEAGISASTPSYTPIGFSYYGPASHSGGIVNITYKDKMNLAKQYVISESKSAINSATIATTNTNLKSSVLTSQVNGNTVYIYQDAKTASWVSDGILYTITNNAGLSSDQLLNIVASM